MDDLTIQIDELVVEGRTAALAGLEVQVGLGLVDHFSRVNMHPAVDLGGVGSVVAEAIASVVRSGRD